MNGVVRFGSNWRRDCKFGTSDRFSDTATRSKHFTVRAFAEASSRGDAHRGRHPWMRELCGLQAPTPACDKTLTLEAIQRQLDDVALVAGLLELELTAARPPTCARTSSRGGADPPSSVRRRSARLSSPGAPRWWTTSTSSPVLRTSSSISGTPAPTARSMPAKRSPPVRTEPPALATTIGVASPGSTSRRTANRPALAPGTARRGRPCAQAHQRSSQTPRPKRPRRPRHRRSPAS